MNWLKKKKINIVYVVIFSLAAVISYLVNVNLREKLLVITLSESFFWLAAFVLFFSITTLFFKRSVFLSWVKITKYFLIISIIIILLTPTSTHGLDFFPIIKETVTIMLISLYSIISLFLIIYKSFQKQ